MQCITMKAKIFNQGDGWPIQTSQSRTAPPLTARAKTGAIFVKRIGLRRAIRYRPAEPPPSSRDENSILVKKSKSGMSDKSDPAGILPRPPDENLVFATNCTPSEPTLPLQTTGQRADCRGRGFQFSSRDFLLGDCFPDPPLVALSFAYLESSYRTTPQW